MEATLRQQSATFVFAHDLGAVDKNADWLTVTNKQARLQAKRYSDWRATVQNLVIIELGAGLSIPSVRLFSEDAARMGSLIRINPQSPHIRVSLKGLPIPLGALESTEGISSALNDAGFWDGS